MGLEQIFLFNGTKIAIVEQICDNSTHSVPWNKISSTESYVAARRNRIHATQSILLHPQLKHNEC